MNVKRDNVIKSMNDFLQEANEKIKELREKLVKVTLQRDVYKEMLSQKQDHKNHIAYTVIYFRDNGEGVDTETCVGVFSTKALGLQAILDVCKENKEISFEECKMEEFEVGQALIPDEIVNVVHFDEEAHCERSTTVMGIYEEMSTNHLHKDCYLLEYVVDRIYSIE